MQKKATYKSTYWEKLKDPRWQKKRLEILSLHEFACQDCGSTEDTLHVHHPYYEKNKEPWDYDEDVLMCVCENCHQSAHQEENLFNEYVNKVKSGGSGRNLMFYAGLLAGFSHDGPFDLEVINYEFAEGLGIYFKKTPEEIIGVLEDGFLRGSVIFFWATGKYPSN